MKNIRIDVCFKEIQFQNIDFNEVNKVQTLKWNSTQPNICRYSNLTFHEIDIRQLKRNKTKQMKRVSENTN